MNKLEQVYSVYRPTIGIECHVQLATKSKLFVGVDNDARDKPANTTVSSFCFGFPGVLPVLNKSSVTYAIRAGLALNAEIPEVSRFERKHYFYPDLPLGYQITQLAEPVILRGHVMVPQLDSTEIRVNIHHAHLEADAGKLTHPAGSPESYVDLNRVGTPLIEIVSEPDMHSPAEARAYAQELYKLMVYSGVTNGDLYHGNMRFDVNISLAKIGDDKLGTRAEIKNLNSFRAVEKAAEFECIRQSELLDKGQQVVQETRGWNEDKQITFSQRTKESAHDYRYFPDPDLPIVRVDKKLVESTRSEMPTMPADYRQAWHSLGIDKSVVRTLLADKRQAELIYTIQKKEGDVPARRVANWFSSVVSSNDNENAVPKVIPSAKDLVELAKMTDTNEISGSNAKLLFAMLLEGKTDPKKLAVDGSMLQLSDEQAISDIVDQVLADVSSEKAVADVRSGNDKAIGFLVGQIMKISRGQANPAVVQKMIRERLL